MRNAVLVVVVSACGASPATAPVPAVQVHPVATPPAPPAPIVQPAPIAPPPPRRPAGRLIDVTDHGVTIDGEVVCDGAPDAAGYPASCLDFVKMPKLVAAIKRSTDGDLVVQIGAHVPMTAVAPVLTSIGNAGVGTFSLGDGAEWRTITNYAGDPPTMVTLHFHARGQFYVLARAGIGDGCAPDPVRHVTATELGQCIDVISARHPALVGLYLNALDKEYITVAQLWLILGRLDRSIPLALAP